MLYEPSSFNQLSNTKNPYQSDATKALCVCSAGLLRSPSIAAYLTQLGGYNTRACGTSIEYALVPLSEALLTWAEEIHVVAEQEQIISKAMAELNLSTPVYIYNIPDRFETFSPELMDLIKSEYEHNL
jgi:predicted protein tyrosine phosphatase